MPVNGVCEIPLNDGCMLLYADDILLYLQIRNQSDFLLLQEDINMHLHFDAFSSRKICENQFCSVFISVVYLYQENVCVL